MRPDNELEAELIEARALNAIGPDLVPLDAADGAHQVDLHRRHAHLHHPTTIRYRFGTQLRHGKAERLERLENPHRVFQRRPNEDVEITGEPRGAVEGERVRAYDDELNPMGSRGPDKLVEVGRQLQSICLRRYSTAATRSAGGRESQVAQRWTRPLFFGKRRQAHDSLQFRRHKVPLRFRLIDSQRSAATGNWKLASTHRGGNRRTLDDAGLRTGRSSGGPAATGECGNHA